ncbi:MAG: PIN domain-containing protein [Bacillota bacterium]
MVFADASGLVALADGDDHQHVAAAIYARSAPLVPGWFVTTNYVLDKTFTVLRSRIGLSHTVAFGEALMKSNLCSIVQVDAQVQELAWEWFKKYADKGFNFTDCTSFVVMTALSLQEAFTFDRHFAQAGFVCRPT